MDSAPKKLFKIGPFGAHQGMRNTLKITTTRLFEAAEAADKAILRAGPIESFYLFKKLLTLQDDDFLMPSTGACVVNYFSRRALASDHILLAGFQHIGWEGHPWSAEKELFRLYANLDNIDVVD